MATRIIWGGGFVTARNFAVRNGEAWTPLQRTNLWARDGGTWKAFTLPLPPPFNGTLRPSGDVLGTNWTPSSGVDLWAMLDETTADDDTTHIEGPLEGSDVQPCSSGRSETSNFDVALTNPGSDPNGTETVTVRFRSKRVDVAGLGGELDWIIELREGANVRATRTTSLIGAAYETFTFTLTQNEKDSVTSWSSVSVRGRPRMCGEPGEETGLVRPRVTWIEVAFTGGTGE